MARLNRYNMQHNATQTARTGQLVLTMAQDVTPGEVWFGKSTSIVRLDPLVRPTFMSMNVFRRKFFVPYRILDENFTAWWLGDNVSYTPPTIDIGTTAGATKTELLGALCLPLNGAASRNVCAYILMAYNKIWNDHFRQPEISEVSLLEESVKRVSHPHNTYFGRMRKSMQKGDPVEYTPTPNVSAVGMRDAMARQRLQENLAIYGDKYTDRLRYYGVNVNSGLVDESVPISSAKAVMGISEVVETAQTGTDGGAAGQLAGHGITMFTDTLRARKFSEPGLLMEVAYCRPRLSLANKLDRVWLKNEEDEMEAFYNPEMALQSDKAVKSDEIYAGTGSSQNTNYAYCDAYDWLRSANDLVGGLAANGSYTMYSQHKTLANVPTIEFLRYVDDYDRLYQNGTPSARADIQLHVAHGLKKLSPVRRKGRS